MWSRSRRKIQQKKSPAHFTCIQKSHNGNGVETDVTSRRTMPQSAGDSTQQHNRQSTQESYIQYRYFGIYIHSKGSFSQLEEWMERSTATTHDHHGCHKRILSEYNTRATTLRMHIVCCLLFRAVVWNIHFFSWQYVGGTKFIHIQQLLPPKDFYKTNGQVCVADCTSSQTTRNTRTV